MMTTKVSNSSPGRASDDDDECSDDETILSNEGRRRRFEMERKPEILDSRQKRPKLDESEFEHQERRHNISRIVYDRRSSARRRRQPQASHPSLQQPHTHMNNNHHQAQHPHQHNQHQYPHHQQQLQYQHQNDVRQHYPSFVNNSNLRQIPLVNNPTIEIKPKRDDAKQQPQQTAKKSCPQSLKQVASLPPPKGPVIYINPRFIKKFIGKTIELANKTNGTCESSAQKQGMNNKGSKKQISTSKESNMIDNIDFKTSPKESLQAASKMAVIRLVTECIEDSAKRDEELNKTLVSRLIDAL